MSTRSYIAMKTSEDTYRGVYCHYDGYLDYNGVMLLEHYNSKERVEELLSYGNISSLREKITPEKDSTHSFDKPDKDVTIFYGRDRVEEGQEAFTCTEEELKDTTSWIEYIYVFDNGKWYYSVITRIGFTAFIPLEPTIKKIKERKN